MLLLLRACVCMRNVATLSIQLYLSKIRFRWHNKQFPLNICTHSLVIVCTVLCLTSSSLLPFNYSPLSFWQIRSDTVRVCVYVFCILSLEHTISFLYHFACLLAVSVCSFWCDYCCFCRWCCGFWIFRKEQYCNYAKLSRCHACDMIQLAIELLFENKWENKTKKHTHVMSGI